QYELPVARERVSEAGQIGGTETLLALAVENVDVAELPGEPVGELAGPVGGVVVDHQDADALVAERAQHRLEVLALVVGGEADDGFGHLHVRIFNAWPELCLATWTWPSNWSSSPTCSRSKERLPSGSWPIAAPPPGSARRRARWPNWRSPAAPRSCRESARRSRRRSSRSSRTVRCMR